ncbi:MAG: hypothetical protein KF884_00810 [Fimbriimonadaceae bacterium]|nr:hypothetical protein [Fimbriimonadaceae bacterium]QYK58636.1 MAG: hypothetical protein KF884_00810 [Fimbriimonadaceae bacterium]
MIRVSFNVIALVSLVLAGAQEASAAPRFLVDAARVLVIDQPELVSAGRVFWFDLSPDGRFALLLRERDRSREFVAFLSSGKEPNDVADESILAVWDAESGQVKELAREMGRPLFANAVWTTDPKIAVITLANHDRSGNPMAFHLRADLIKGSTTKLSLPPGQYTWTANPKGGSMVAYGYGAIESGGGPVEMKPGLRVFDLAGKQLSWTPWPEDRQIPSESAWTEDGTRLMFRVPDPGRGIQRTRTYVFDPANPRVIETEEALTARKTQEPEYLTLVERIKAQSGGQTEWVPALWLVCSSQQDARALVATEVESEAKWSDKGLVAAFVSRGSLWATRAHRIPRERYEEWVAGQERTQALMAAKAMGLAVFSYASDHEDWIPNSDQWRSAVEKYLQGPADPRFVYTFKGGRLDQVAEPHATEVGHIVIRNGKVVLYVDGSARFVKD